MEDVKPIVSETKPGEGETPEPVPQPAEQTPEVPEKTTAEPVTVAEEATERTVPISVVQKERKQRQELQRELAELKGSQKLKQYEPEDMDTLMSHPFVQELLVKNAKQELTSYARELLEQHSGLNPTIKKAILKNARGFVNEATTDVETAKLDLQAYVEELVDDVETQAPVAPKSFPVANTNVAKTDVPGTRPGEVQKILDKPVDEWSPEESKVVNDYRKSH